MKEFWKQGAALGLALCMALALAACGGEEAGSSQPSGSGDISSTEDGLDLSGLELSGNYAVVGTDLPAVEYTDRDLSGDYYDNVTEITLGSGDVVITEPGTYILSGTLADGQIRVEAGDTEKVQLVLNEVYITNEDGPAIYVKSADKVFITLADGTENFLADGETYNVAGDENEPDGCVFSQEDLTINGSGSLTVTGNYSHGIITKDDLTITGGVITVTAANEGLKGKDAVQICGGTIIVDAADDAIATSNEDDADKGWMSIDGGELTLTAGDDGLHAEGALVITGGTINILSSVEGIEGRSITITGGTITVNASDDGLNAAGGVGGTSGSLFGGFGQSGSANYICISGGTLTVIAQGDGVDSNNVLLVSGGTLLVSQQGNDDSALDADGGAMITGGTVAAAGASQMAETFSSDSTQYSFLYVFGSTVSGGTEITVADGSGAEMISFTPELDCQSVVISTPELTEGTYTVTAGSVSGEITLSGISTSNGGFGGDGFFGGGKGGGMRGDFQTDGDWSDDFRQDREVPDGMELPSDEFLPDEFPSGELPSGEQSFGGKPDGGMERPVDGQRQISG